MKSILYVYALNFFICFMILLEAAYGPEKKTFRKLHMICTYSVTLCIDRPWQIFLHPIRGKHWIKSNNDIDGNFRN
jgi:hypothetical protein